MLKKEEEVMSKRKKKNVLTLVFLLIALAALCGVYFWYNERIKEKEEETSAISLTSIDTDSISSMHYVHDDADIVLVLKDDVWISEEEPERPIKQSNVTQILNAIKEIKADRVVTEKAESLAEYGLEEPESLLEVSLKDGSTVTIKVGKELINSEGYYGMVNNDGKVYQLSSDLGSALQFANTELTDIRDEDSPKIESDNITYISVQNKNGTDIELKKYADKVYDNAGNALNYWKILKPYGEGYAADDTKMSEVLSNYSKLSYLACVDYNCDDFAGYGLDDPAATIHVGYNVTRTKKLDKPEKDPDTDKLITEKTYYDPYEYTLYIGNKNDEGNYYVRMDGSKAVYTLYNGKVDEMLNVDAFNLLYVYALMPNIQEVDKIEAVVNGKSYNMEIKRRTEKNDEGKEETVATYYFNGKESEEKAFKTDLYMKMITSQYDAEIKEDVNLEGVEPILAMSFHVFGDGEGTYSAEFYPYNESFDIIKKPDGKTFFADKRRIDSIIEAITTFTGKAKETE